MSRVDAEKELDRLRAATEPIAPDDGFTDAILAAARSTDAAEALDPLAKLGRATEALEPAPAFTDAVMSRAVSARAARRAPVSWRDGVSRSGPFALGLAVVAAAASFLIFLSSERDVDATMASSVDTVEVIE